MITTTTWVILLGALTAASAQEPARRWQLGPQPLTEETYQEAVTCGAESPWWRYCAEENRNLNCNSTSVYVSLVTPFVRVMTAVDDADTQLRKPSPPSMASVNRTGATLVVSPGSSFTTMGSPTRLVVERNGRRYDPEQTSFTKVSMENALGAKRPGQEGRFTFPIELFSVRQLEGELSERNDFTTIVTVIAVLDNGGQARCELFLQKLKQMR